MPRYEDVTTLFNGDDKGGQALTVAALYERRFFLESTKYRRS